MVEMKEIVEIIIRGKVSKVEESVRRALEDGQDGGKIIEEGLLAGLTHVGERWKRGECYLPEVLIVARNIKAGMEVIRRYLGKKEIEEKGTVVIGTVKGDIHDIGKNIVGMLLAGAGFKVIDLGVDVSPDKFVHTAKEQNADIIGLSALITTTMPEMKVVVDSINESGIRAKVKVIVGGAPITQGYADEIGADGYAVDAVFAVEKVGELLQN